MGKKINSAKLDERDRNITKNIQNIENATSHFMHFSSLNIG
jgi:hypothetical protein